MSGKVKVGVQVADHVPHQYLLIRLVLHHVRRGQLKRAILNQHAEHRLVLETRDRLRPKLVQWNKIQDHRVRFLDVLVHRPSMRAEVE